MISGSLGASPGPEPHCTGTPLQWSSKSAASVPVRANRLAGALAARPGCAVKCSRRDGGAETIHGTRSPEPKYGRRAPGALHTAAAGEGDLIPAGNDARASSLARWVENGALRVRRCAPGCPDVKERPGCGAGVSATFRGWAPWPPSQPEADGWSRGPERLAAADEAVRRAPSPVREER